MISNSIICLSFKGISGGFAPSTPSEIHTITLAANSGNLAISSAYRLDGTPTLQDAVPKTLPFDGQHDDQALVEELVSILQSIPQPPPGSADVYGLDTSIAFGSEDFMWQNGGPQGCGGGESSVQPTEEQKAKFKRAVEIVQELQSKDA